MEYGPVTLDRLLVLHQAIGYPVALVLGPLALASFAGRWRHRAVGLGYAAGMTVLYLTGSAFTFTQYAYASWEFWRNVVFNLVGALYVAMGLRAGMLWRAGSTAEPALVDHALRWLLSATVALMLGLAVIKSTPLRVFTLLSLILLWLEHRDWRRGFTRAVSYARHARYSLAGYFYLMTVLSIVHLRDEVPGLARWIAPSLLGACAIWVVNGAVTPGHRLRTRLQRPTIAVVVAVSVLLAGYAVWEAWRDGFTRFPNHPPATARHP